MCGRLCYKKQTEIAVHALTNLLQAGSSRVSANGSALPAATKSASDFRGDLAPLESIGEVTPSATPDFPGADPAVVPNYLDYIGHTDCLPMCEHLMDQCCTFCLYSSWSFSIQDADSAAARRSCFEECPATIEKRFRSLPPHDHPLGTTTTTTPAPVPLPPPPLAAPAPVQAPVAPPVAAPAPAPLPVAAPGPAPAKTEKYPDLDFNWASADDEEMSHPKLPPFPAVACVCTDDCRDTYDLCTSNCLSIYGAPLAGSDTAATRCYQACSDNVCEAQRKHSPVVVELKVTIQGIDYASMVVNASVLTDLKGQLKKGVASITSGGDVQSIDIRPGSLRVSVAVEPKIDEASVITPAEAATGLSRMLQQDESELSGVILNTTLAINGIYKAITGNVTLSNITFETVKVVNINHGVLKAIPAPTPSPVPPPCPPSVWRPNVTVIVDVPADDGDDDTGVGSAQARKAALFLYPDLEESGDLNPDAVVGSRALQYAMQGAR